MPTGSSSRWKLSCLFKLKVEEQGNNMKIRLQSCLCMKRNWVNQEDTKHGI